MDCRHLIVAMAGMAVAAAAAVLPIAGAQQAPAQGAATTPPFDEAFLSNTEHIKSGEALWEQCRHCHGASAYPGKAPKLNPGLLEPDFIYDRVTNGFQKMPPWKDVYSDQQRMDLVAYIKSKSFSP